jgi:hypothetical protein
LSNDRRRRIERGKIILGEEKFVADELRSRRRICGVVIHGFDRRFGHQTEKCKTEK